MKLKQITADMLCGLGCAGCACLFSAAAFPGKIGIMLAAAVPTVLICTALLWTKRTNARRLRSITAIVGFLPAVWFSIRAGIHTAVYTLFNPDYIREYGSPNIGDAGGLFLIYIPAALILLLLSVFLAKLHFSPQEQQNHEEKGQIP